MRPDFQNPGAATIAVARDLDLGEAPAPKLSATIPPWPKCLPEQVSAVAAVLGALPAIGRARKLANGRYAA